MTQMPGPIYSPWRTLLRTAILMLCCSVGAVHAQTSAGLAEVRIRGDVRCIQPMGDGSFVLGGFTAYLNGERTPQLIRLMPDGQRVVFPVEVNGSVQTMALSGGWLYLGGDFQQVNGVSCPFAARVNAATGAVDAAWRPAPNGDLLDIVPVSGGIVLSGSFSRVAGLPRSRLALVSAQGAGLPAETWRCDADNQVDRLVLHQGWLYAAGRYKKIGGTALAYLTRVNPATGSVDPAWNPNPNGPVYDVSGDNAHLYCAGGFSRIGNASLFALARMPINSTSGDVSWAPLPDSLVVRVCVSGDSVYAAGNFVTISGLPQKYLARIPRNSGSADNTWRPPLDGALLALIPDGAGGCWGGGRFDSGGTGSGFARFTALQGTTAPAYPASVENIGAVKVIKPVAAGGWLVGGDFDMVNGVKSHALFRLLGNRTVDAAWNAGLGGTYTQVNAMDVIDSAGDVLIGGQFEVPGIAGALIYNCLRLKLADGQPVITFKPLPSGPVYSIVRETDTWLLGGSFEKMGAQTAPYIARLSTEGHIDPIFSPKPNGPVHTILKAGDDVYLGGEFTGFTVGQTSLPLPYLARLNNIAPDIAWQPRPNQAVFALAAEGNFLYAGGRFDRMARVRRKYLAQIPMGGAGTATSWNPAPDDEVRSLRIDSGRLYAGGAFFNIGGYRWPKLARFQLGTQALDTTFRSTGENGAVYAIEPQPGGELFIGGTFNGWDDDRAKRSLIRIVPGAAGAPPPQFAMPPPEDTPDLLADYFAPSSTGYGSGIGPVPPGDGPGIAWEENAALPAGMVSRVQWSQNLTDWHESGESVNGTPRFIEIAADGSRRTARLTGHEGDASVFLRVVVTGGENPPSVLPR